MFLEVGTYTLVAYRDYQAEGVNYLPACQEVTVVLANDPVEQEIVLEPVGESGVITISGKVYITDVVDSLEQEVLISFRQASGCEPGEEIEIKSIGVAEIVAENPEDVASYSVTLPAGTYTVVSSTATHTTQEETVSSTTTLDLTFPKPSEPL
jgi:hypothetical protein